MLPLPICVAIYVYRTFAPKSHVDRTTVVQKDPHVSNSPIEWGEAVAPPPSPEQGTPSLKRIEPYYPKETSIIWFMSKPFRVLTHYRGSTWPHMTQDCQHCQFTNPEVSWYASILLKTGSSESGRRHMWEPRVLKVPDRNIIELADDVLNKIYSLIIFKKGSVTRYRFEYRNIAKPSIEPFCPKEVMEAIWFPHLKPTKVERPSEVYTEVPESQMPVTRAAASQPTFAEECATKQTSDLVDLLTKFRSNGTFKVMQAIIEAELATRHVAFDTDEPKDPKEKKPGKYKLGVYTEPMPETPQKKVAEGGAF